MASMMKEPPEAPDIPSQPPRRGAAADRLLEGLRTLCHTKPPGETPVR